MKGKVKNFLLNNIFNIILLTGLLGAYIFFTVAEIKQDTMFYFLFSRLLLIYVITTVIHFYYNGTADSFCYL